VKHRKAADLRRLGTEKTNVASANLSQKSAIEIASIINAEDAKVAGAVKRALPQIGQAIDLIAAALRKGGRLIYVGAGTSGRLGALDASECTPTFNTDPGTVQFVMAGGPRALAAPVEASEDSIELGRSELARKKPGKDDVVVGIAASGRTPFTVAALRYARAHGAKTVAVTSNPNSPLGRSAHVSIVAEVGPEVLAGSTRMKAGTAQKMILNMLSTGAMTRLGYVYGNLMVNLHLKNEKLVGRGIGILEKASGASRETVKQAMKQARNSLPVALVMLEANISRSAAKKALSQASGDVGQAIKLARR
jgi:N-acetylmuramic acid 6-phosphate etherase